jgi:hypothetical protein
MNTQLKLHTIAASLLTAATLAGCASEPPEPAIRDAMIQKTATVESVHLPTRMVALRLEDGTTTSVQVGPTVQNLDQVQVGDQVVVSYYEGLAAQVKKPGEGVEGVEETGEVVTARPGERPAGAVGATIRTTVKIESVDKSTDTVTFKRPDGLTRSLAVESPEGKEFIRKLKPGDEVEVTYTEAIAIEVKPAGK